MSDEQVPLGETVLTSGGDQIFPKGLPVGIVTKVAGSDSGLFLNVKVRPAADLGRLEEVLVVLAKQERQGTVEQTGRMRAVDILAQRLPSVPDKPAGNATLGVAGAPAASGAVQSHAQPQVQSQAQVQVKTAKPQAPAAAPPQAQGGGATKPQQPTPMASAAAAVDANDTGSADTISEKKTVAPSSKPASSQPKPAPSAADTSSTDSPH
jgi:rod shape-determining protein MreC